MKHLSQQNMQRLDIDICSVYLAYLLVIEAALRFVLNSERKVLIEDTSNQVNQYGGYTVIKPADFRDYVHGCEPTLSVSRKEVANA